MATETLRPNGVGNETNLLPYAPNTGEANWEDVDEAVADDMTTCLGAYGASYLRDLYTIPAHSVGSGVINSATIHWRYRTSNVDTPPSGASRSALRTHSVTYDGAEKEQHGIAVWYNESQVYTTNPNTGSAWTWAEIDALEIGWSAKAGQIDKNVYPTQIYVVIDYTEVVADAPTVATQAATDVSRFSCVGNGNITDTGGENATRRGFCYKEGVAGDPTTVDSVAYDDGDFGTGAYTKAITDLKSDTGYRVRAYAVNSGGTGYGTTIQVTTLKAVGAVWDFFTWG